MLAEESTSGRDSWLAGLWPGCTKAGNAE